MAQIQFCGQPFEFKIVQIKTKTEKKQCVIWVIRTCLWTGNGLICCLWFQLSMGHCFTLLTHSAYIKQGCKWWWEPESLTKGTPVGRAMTDSFSGCFSPRHRSLVLAFIIHLPSKKLGHNHKRVYHLFPLFVAIVKKKMLC